MCIISKINPSRVMAGCKKNTVYSTAIIKLKYIYSFIHSSLRILWVMHSERRLKLVLCTLARQKKREEKEKRGNIATTTKNSNLSKSTEAENPALMSFVGQS